MFDKETVTFVASFIFGQEGTFGGCQQGHIISCLRQDGRELATELLDDVNGLGCLAVQLAISSATLSAHLISF